MVRTIFQLNLSPHAKKLEMQYLKDNTLFSVPFSYNTNSCKWEIDNLVLNQNCLYFFCLNDSNYFLDPSNQNVHIAKNTMMYSVYNQNKNETYLDLILAVQSFKIQNNNLDSYLFTENFFVTDELVGLLIDMNKDIINTIKENIILTFEWIGPNGTYYITDKFLSLDFLQNSSKIKHGLRIDSCTMKPGKWTVRILVNNVLNYESVFFIQSVTYKNPYSLKK